MHCLPLSRVVGGVKPIPATLERHYMKTPKASPDVTVLGPVTQCFSIIVFFLKFVFWFEFCLSY